MEWVLVKMLLSLAAVLGLMFGVVWLLRRFITRGAGPASRPVEIEIVGSRVLEQRKSVYVLKILQNVIVVGVTEHGMNTLAEIRDEQSLGAIEERLAKSGHSKIPSFSSYFTKHLGSFVCGTQRVSEQVGVQKRNLAKVTEL